ncbi:MAG: EamA family transporter [Caldisericia bacterium]|nr:EamA family transporter [Caldisericia bacterium]MDD4614109.1 EamA family transporter [Caldisericia bacterium]
MINPYILFTCAVIIAAHCQILLKMSANKHHASKFKEYVNPLVMVAYIFLFLSSFLTILAYKSIPLKEGPVIQSLGYIIVLFLSTVILKERVSKKTLLGTIVIVIGIFIFTL